MRLLDLEGKPPTEGFKKSVNPAFEENKFIVINVKDFEALSRTNRNTLVGVLDKLYRDRESVGKDPMPRYYVCNQDEPYAGEVLKAILDGEGNKNAKA